MKKVIKALGKGLMIGGLIGAIAGAFGYKK